jgi:hypothetical protein
MEPQGGDDGASLLERMLALRDMPGKKVLVSLRLLRMSAYVFQRNHAELTRFIDFCEGDPKNRDLSFMTTRKKSDEYAHETVRLLHNFEASAVSLRDHTETLYRQFHDEGVFTDYKPELARRFTESPVIQIVQKLRVYVLHVRAPAIAFQTTVDNPNAAGSLMTLRLGIAVDDEFRAWDGWNPPARRYLSEAGDFLHVRPLITEYAHQVASFYEWFGAREREVHRAAIGEYEAKENEYFILKIGRNLDAYFSADPSAPPFGDRSLFIGLFDVSDFETLEALPVCSSERTEAALGLLREHLPIPGDLEAKIRKAYGEPRFFAPSSARAPREAGGRAPGGASLSFEGGRVTIRISPEGDDDVLPTGSDLDERPNPDHER